MGVSVCFASGKDGVGKSVITANLGIALSNLGISTLIVDGDIAGTSIGLVLGVDPGSPSIHDCLSGNATCDEAIIEVHGTNAIVGGIQIEQLVDVSLEGFSNIIEELTEKFDVVLVDSPAGLGTDAVTVMSSCQSLILVLTPDINSITNTLKSLAVAKRVGTAVLGAIVNRTGGAYDIPSDKISDLLKVRIIAEVNEDEKVKQSLLDAAPIYSEAPDSKFSQQIKEIANKLIGGD
jgi:septum site-determining protein MinD